MESIECNTNEIQKNNQQNEFIETLSDYHFNIISGNELADYLQDELRGEINRGNQDIGDRLHYFYTSDIQAYETNLILQKNEKIVGHLSIEKNKDEYRLTSISVDPEYKKKGLGTFLIKKFFSYMKEIGAQKIIISNWGKEGEYIEKVTRNEAKKTKDENKNMEIKFNSDEIY